MGSRHQILEKVGKTRAFRIALSLFCVLILANYFLGQFTDGYPSSFVLPLIVLTAVTLTNYFLLTRDQLCGILIKLSAVERKHLKFETYTISALIPLILVVIIQYNLH